MNTSIRLITGLVALVLAPFAGAATAPFNETFDSAISGWTNTGTATWSVTGGYYQAVSATSSGAFSSSVSLTNINSTTFAPGTSFTISSTFQITDATSSGGNEYYGLGLFGGAANFGNAYYLADVQRSGSIRLVGLNGGATDLTGGTAVATGVTLALNTNYILQFTGTYGIDGSISMTFALLDSASSVIKSVSAVDTTPLTGTNFGYRLNNANSGDAMTAQFDNFTVASAIPEPSAYAALAGVASLGMVFCSRRRRTQTSR